MGKGSKQTDKTDGGWVQSTFSENYNQNWNEKILAGKQWKNAKIWTFSMKNDISEKKDFEEVRFTLRSNLKGNLPTCCDGAF